MGRRRCDVIVVGGGAMGSAAAWALAGRGRDVVLLERFERGHLRGGSHGTTRIFRLGYPDADYIAMGTAALDLWRRLEAQTGLTLLETTGAIDHGDGPTVDAIEAALRASGVACERLAAGDAAERWPGMSFAGPVLLQPDGGRLYAERAVAALQDAAVAAGAEVRYSCPVVDLRQQGDGVVTADVIAPVAVLAVGSWAPAFRRDLPAIRVTLEQPAHFPPRRADDEWPSFVHYGHHGAVTRYGLLTPGEGVKVGEHGTGPVVDPDRRAFDPDPAVVARLRGYVEEWLPGVDPQPASVTTCLYDSTPNDDFVLDRRGSIVVATGFSGHGFKFTPLIGTLLADLALGGERLAPRFRLDRPGAA